MTGERTHADGLKIKGYRAVREFALDFPEAYEEFPWGHCAIKVRKKIFVILGAFDAGFTMSLKLTGSNFDALLLPFTEPTHYGMGKHGWVTSRFAAREKPPLAMLHGWIDESFRAVAPKTVVAKLATGATSTPPKPATRRKASKPAARRAALRKKPASPRVAAGKKVRKRS